MVMVIEQSGDNGVADIDAVKEAVSCGFIIICTVYLVVQLLMVYRLNH